MSSSEGTKRGRPRTRSMSDSRAKSTSPDPGPSSILPSSTRIKSIIKGKPIPSRSTSRSSNESDRYFDSQDTAENVNADSGLLPILRNLQFGTHVALRKTDGDIRKNADRLIKKDSNQMLERALKQERAKMGSQLMTYLVEGSSTSTDSEVPQLLPHDPSIPSCSIEEFDRLLKSLARSHPRFDGKSSELLYFLLELAELRISVNLSDFQLQRIMQNRLSGRLLIYFLTELKRDDVTTVVNRLSYDFIETINTSDEVERYLGFKFLFKNLASELTTLKQSVALAHPNITRQALSQKYLERVIALLPYDQRHTLIDDISRRQKLVDIGILEFPYSDHELDSRILFHCRGLDKKVHKNICQLTNADVSGPEPDRSRPQAPFDSTGANELVAAIRQLTRSNESPNECREFVFQSQGDPNYPGVDSGNRRNSTLVQPRQQRGENVGASNLQRRFGNANPQQFEKRPPQQNFVNPPRDRLPGGYNQTRERFREQGRRENYTDHPQRPAAKETVLLANPTDPHYENLVREARDSKNYKFLGEKIRDDIVNSAPKFRDALRQTKLSKSVTQKPYTWINGRYSTASRKAINFPVFRKIGSRSPDLTSEALKHFSRCCYACGFDSCVGKNSSGCAYNRKPDSWFLCPQCNLGFHLGKDCLAQIKN